MPWESGSGMLKVIYNTSLEVKVKLSELKRGECLRLVATFGRVDLHPVSSCILCEYVK